MKNNSGLIKTIPLLIFVFTAYFGLNAQPYQTDYPFDSIWVDNFNGPVFNIVDLGAVPDDNINDSQYFRMAADSIEFYGTGKLIIPAGEYNVGEQSIHPEPGEPYYQEKEIFSVENADQIIIEGEEGAKLKMADELHYGSFDPITGEVHNAPSGGFYDDDYAAEVGIMFDFRNSSNIFIKNIELDGNIDSITIGGYWADTGIQLEAIGILMLGNSNVLLRDVHSHHHGLDGIEIGYYYLTEDSSATVHVLENIVSEYNGRQGFSWIGGIGITAYNCKFNHTGRAAIVSAPASGVDIEAEESICRGGKFINCEFINNTNTGLVADSGDGGYSTFENCTFWGTTDWAVWNDKPGMVFNDCNFYGSIVHAYGSVDHPELATKYNNCYFEDKEHPDYGVFRGYMLVNHDMDDGSNVTFDGCEFVANKLKSMWLTHNGNGNIFIKNSTITHKAIDVVENNDFQANFAGVHFENVQFMEDYPTDFDSTYYINIYSGVEIGNCVFVEGPTVKWRHWLEDINPYGWILPGFHPMEQSLDILSPDGGENWEAGSTYDILWDYEHADYTIAIELYKGCEYLSTLVLETENNGSFQWTISDTLETGDDYSIKTLTTNYPTDFAFSDTTFSIVNLISANKKTSMNSGIVVFPNPVKSVLYINYKNAEKIKDISISDIMGRQRVSFSGRQYEIDMSGFSKGVYFLKMVFENKMVFKKIIVD